MYIPSTVHDGVLLRIGNQGYTGYLNLYEQRRDVPTDVTIELSGEHSTGQTYSVSAEVAIEPGDGDPRTMRVYMVQVLDYWPAYGGYHRNGFKQAAATEDITLSPGESQVVERDLTFDTDMNAKTHSVAFVPQCVRDYELSYHDGKQWRILAAVKGNFQRRRVHRFDPISTARLRLTIQATNSDPAARIFEIRVYKE